jgi:hypothetical protein
MADKLPDLGLPNQIVEFVEAGAAQLLAHDLAFLEAVETVGGLIDHQEGRGFLILRDFADEPEAETVGSAHNPQQEHPDTLHLLHGLPAFPFRPCIAPGTGDPGLQGLPFVVDFGPFAGYRFE